MKRLISILIILSITLVACMSTAIASFVVGDLEMSKSMSMSSDCPENNHDCCISPFKDSGNVGGINENKAKKELIKVKILDFDFIGLLQEKLEENYMHKLNSPPWQNEISVLSSFYIKLVGSIKSNS